jgi:transposase, IS30 family
MTLERSVQRELWWWIRAGDSPVEAGRRVGVPETSVLTLVKKSGGMPPCELEIKLPSRALVIGEREQILAGVARGESIRAIAGALGRSPSTVQRELRRNMRHRYRARPAAGQRVMKLRRGVVPGVESMSGYRPHRAQLRADRMLARPKVAKLAQNQLLRVQVQTRLDQEHSPEQIANRLREDFPNDPEMWVCHETIYQSLYVQGRGALRRDLHQRLRTGRALRRPRRKSGERSSQRRARIPGMVNIAERPPEVDDRKVPGHWEGDLIIGKDSGSAIGTLVERTTRFVMLLHLPGNHGADVLAEAMITAMAQLPEQLRHTLTWDQGIEMTNHAQIAKATDLEIFFCDPHAPWQRGSNENTNGLLRQYFPKGTDLSVYQPDYLEHVARKLNNRPRQTLAWRTPSEALDKLLSEPNNPPGVALTS